MLLAMHRAKLGVSCKLPTSLWAASSQLLDVTAFPALEKGRPKKPEKPSQEKKWEEEGGAKPREGLRRRCRRWHGFSRTRTAGTPARGSSAVKNWAVLAQARVAMNGEGTAARGVPVRQIQLQKSMWTVVAPFGRGNPEENEMRICDSDEERSAGRMGES